MMKGSGSDANVEGRGAMGRSSSLHPAPEDRGMDAEYQVLDEAAPGLASLPHDALSSVLERVGMPWLLPCEAVSSRLRESCASHISNLTRLDLSVCSRLSHNCGHHFSSASAGRRPWSSRRMPTMAGLSLSDSDGEDQALVVDDILKATLFPETTPTPQCRILVVDTQLRALTLRCPHLIGMCLRSCNLRDTTRASACPQQQQQQQQQRRQADEYRETCHHARDVGWSYNALLHATRLQQLDVSHAVVTRAVLNKEEGEEEEEGEAEAGFLGKFGPFLPMSIEACEASGLVCEAPYDLWRGALSCSGIRNLTLPSCSNSAVLAKTVILLGGKCQGLEHFAPSIGSCQGQIVSVALQAMTLGCPSLKTLDLTSVAPGNLFCEALFKTLSTHATRLQGLALLNQTVDSKALDSLMLITCLKHLLIPNCEGYTQQSITSLVGTLSLETLSVDHAPAEGGESSRSMRRLAISSPDDLETTLQGVEELASGGDLRELYFAGRSWSNARALSQRQELAMASAFRNCTGLDLLYLDMGRGLDKALESIAVTMPNLTTLCVGAVGERGLAAIARLERPLEALMLRHMPIEGEVREESAAALTFLYNWGSPKDGFPEESAKALISRLLGECGKGDGVDGEVGGVGVGVGGGCVGGGGGGGGTRQRIGKGSLMSSCAAVLRRHAGSLEMLLSAGPAAVPGSGGSGPHGAPSIMASCVAAMILNGRLKALRTLSLPGAAPAVSRVIHRVIAEGCDDNGLAAPGVRKFRHVTYDDSTLQCQGGRGITPSGPALIWPTLASDSPCCPGGSLKGDGMEDGTSRRPRTNVEGSGGEMKAARGRTGLYWSSEWT